MEWASDTFSLNDARVVLNLFAPDKATERGCKTLCKYLEEIPAPHDTDAYVNYFEQITPTAVRAGETGSVDAELWFYALSVRTLSFEIEKNFDGPVRELLRGVAKESDQNQGNKKLAH
ncbi:MAG: hypothetical protein ACJAVM_002125 [Sulfitobacter sp.]|jgi:hypothetical protein